MPDSVKTFLSHASYEKIETVYRPLKCVDGATLLEVELITGKSHQIRAHLSALGHPIIGDVKYGCAGNIKGFSISRQFLHAYKIIFPECGGAVSGISGKTFFAKLPGDLAAALKGKADFTEAAGYLL